MSPRAEGLLFLVVLVGLTGVMSWPLAPNLGDEVPLSGNPVDPPAVLYGLGWGAQILRLDPLRYYDAGFFYPHERSLTFLDQMAGLVLLSAPVDWVTGNRVLAYNTVWVLTFVLSGWGSYLLTRDLTGNRGASWLAGVVFAFHPFRYHNAGQLNVLAMMWIPFALLFLHRWMQTGRRRDLARSVLFALLQIISNLYSGVFLLLAGALYLLVLWFSDRDRLRRRVSGQRRPLLIAALAALVALLPFVLPYLMNTLTGVGFRRSLGQAALFSAVPRDFVTPAPGSLLDRLLPGPGLGRHALFPGLVATAMSWMWILGRGWREHPRRPELLFYLALMLVAGFLALGPILGEPGRGVPMPFALAWYVFPGVAFIRAPVRFLVLTSLGIAVLAGAGAEQLTRERVSRGWFSRAGGYMLAGLAAVELFAAPLTLLDPLPGGVPPVYKWLAGLPGRVPILELPMPPHDEGERVEQTRYQLFSLTHGQPLVNGLAAFTPPSAQEMRRRAQQFPGEGSMEMIRHWGVRYVFVHTDQYGEGDLQRMREEVLAHPDLVTERIEPPIWVLRVTSVKKKK